MAKAFSQLEVAAGSENNRGLLLFKQYEVSKATASVGPCGPEGDRMGRMTSFPYRGSFQQQQACRSYLQQNWGSRACQDEVPAQGFTFELERCWKRPFRQVGIKAGETVFTIPEPLLNMIDDGKARLSNTCDNCLASRFDDGITVDREFNACGGCKVIHYCRKSECKTIARLGDYVMPGVLTKPFVNCRGVHIILRFLCLENNKQVPDDLLEEFCGMKTHMEQQVTNELYFNWTHNITKLLYETGISELPQHIVYRIVYAEIVSSLSILGAKLPKVDQANPNNPLQVKLGTTLDAFIAVINHSCDPNTWRTYRGKEFRPTASRDIKAGEESTIKYCTEAGYDVRRKKLMDEWCIDCHCSLCLLGPEGFQPKELLLGELKRFVEL
ncbi:hypothetical protein B0J14DRAFT_663001 [Halenospora varia]|nr:hypothetical protein B0J14DRAFT_663001 [Halenospora varia]